MGATQSIPVVGEAVTVIDSASRTIAAGACAVVGQTDAAGKLIDSAGKSWTDYSERSLITSNIRVLINKDDPKMQDYLLKQQGEAWKSLGENTPVVGHIYGGYSYMTGDSETGDRCMIGATRTAVIATAAVATGGGALVAGGVAVGAAAAYDGVATGIHSARYGEYRPVGYVDAVTTAIKTGDATDIYVAITNPVADFASGAMIKRIATAPAARGAGAPGMLRGAPGEIPRPSVAIFEPKPVVIYGDQVPLANLLPYNVMKTAQNTAQFRTMLRNAGNGQPQVFDFLRRANGEFRFISHQDARVVAANQGRRVGHSSLVEQHQLVVAAGEVFVDAAGEIVNFNSLSGHYQFPLIQLLRGMGPTWPIDLFHNRGIGLNIVPAVTTHRAVWINHAGVAAMLLVMQQQEPAQPAPLRIRPVTQYTIIGTSDSSINPPSLKHCVTIHTNGKIYTVLFDQETLARQTYQQAANHPSRILGEVLDGTLSKLLEKSDGPDTGDVILYLQNANREEPLDWSGLLAPQFLQVLPGDNQELYTLNVKKEDHYRSLQLGRVTIASNEKQVMVPCEIKMNQNPNFLACWDGKVIHKQHLLGNPELLTNQRYMRWVSIQDIKAGQYAGMEVEYGYDGVRELPVYAVCERKTEPGGSYPLLGYWVKGDAQACLIDRTPRNVDDFNVLCWNPEA